MGVSVPASDFSRFPEFVEQIVGLVFFLIEGESG